MTGPVVEKRRRLPMRHCTLCGQQKAALQLMRLRGDWLCAPCYREHVVHARKPSAPARSTAASPAATRDPDPPGSTVESAAGAEVTASAAAPPRPPDPDLLWTLHVVDAGFRYGGLALRVLVYGALYALAENTGFGPHLLAGFLLADGITWTVAATFDLRFHRLAVAAETLFFGVMFWLWLRTGWSFPDQQADRAILGLAALATFTSKTAVLATRLTR